MNSITFLPDEFGKLAQLDEVDFSNNELTSLPASFSKLSKLRTVKFNNNKISTVPNDCFKSSERISDLFLSGNEISNIQFLNNVSTTLCRLRLGFNKITQFNCISKLVNLRELNLSGNRNLVLPDLFFETFAGLLNLFMSHCNLESVTSVPFMQKLKLLHRLQHLSLANNSLKEEKLPLNFWFKNDQRGFFRSIDLSFNQVAYKDGWTNEFLNQLAKKMVDDPDVQLHGNLNEVANNHFADRHKIHRSSRYNCGFAEIKGPVRQVRQ